VSGIEPGEAAKRPRPTNRIFERRLSFAAPALEGWEWPVIDIVGPQAGPRLCVIAGIHVNEVSGIEAALRLASRFGSAPFSGIVSIMPVVNLPALPLRSQFICPVDGRNINFSFPGARAGTFSEAIADAILNEWACDADCLVDLHGGDLCENVARFTVVPTTGDEAFDAFNLRLAEAFGPQIIVRLPSTELQFPGRSCSGRARQRRHAAFAEAGANGLIDAESVAFHFEGVLRVASILGMLDGYELASGAKARTLSATPITADRYLWIRAQADGWCRYAVEPAERVCVGQVIATITDYAGTVLREVISPDDGFVLWRCTHAVVTSSNDLFGIAA
jgi:predicted deacylase